MTAIEVLRWAWILTALVGVVVASGNLREAWLDLRAVGAAGLVNGRRSLARAMFRVALVRSTGPALLLLVGLSAAFHPATEYGNDEQQMYRVLALLLAAALMVTDLVCERRVRYELQQVRHFEHADSHEQNAGGR